MRSYVLSFLPDTGQGAHPLFIFLPVSRRRDAEKTTIMAKSYDNPTPGDPKKPAVNPRLADAQRRAQAMAKGPKATPQQFFEEAWVELKKTSWPNRDVLTKSTTVVLALVVAVAIWVGGLDAALTAVTTNLHIFSAGR